ncbi:substrate-binding domain-containing protein [Rhizobium leguminosarum]|uniref:substrate-binding domain-containing protein n=1 Tax=Rhizobium leguminosarum TaxID=384 RepID=UPI000FEC9241|nr:substrate-binding domain-containing protein [Rhizobium leguminosarum]RWX36659.1 sugar ABC transporter substrate-binding protein [Rhizobium leguminosarum]
MNRRFFLQVSAAALIACTTASQLLAAEADVKKMLDELASGKVQSLGPHGEAPSPADGIQLSEEELNKIKAMNATAAVVLHYRNDWAVAQIAGLTDQFAKMGIKIVSVTDANFKPEKQVADIETVLALKPSIIVSIPVDPVATASAYKKAADAGVKIVFMDNVPQGMEIGKDYVSTVSSDNYGNGVASALLMAQAIEEEGEVGIVYLAGDFFVTKQRYEAFKKTIGQFPNVKVVAEQGIDGTDLIGNAEKAASAILAGHTNIKAIWAVWEAPADGVMSAARTAGRKDLIITTIDLGLNACLSLAKGTFVKGIGAQRPFQQGVTEALLAGYGLLGKKAPDYVVLPPLAVTRENLLESWKLTYHSEPPASLINALN